MLLLYQTVEGDYYITDSHGKLNDTDVVVTKGTLQELEAKVEELKNGNGI